MSAWDVTGAVVWTMAACLMWWACGWNIVHGPFENGWPWMAARDGLVALACTAGAAWCFARLCGAHA